MFSVHTKTQSRRFWIPPVWRTFSKSSVVRGGSVWTLGLTVELKQRFQFSTRGADGVFRKAYATWLRRVCVRVCTPFVMTRIQVAGFRVTKENRYLPYYKTWRKAVKLSWIIWMLWQKRDNLKIIEVFLLWKYMLRRQHTALLNMIPICSVSFYNYKYINDVPSISLIHHLWS